MIQGAQTEVRPEDVLRLSEIEGISLESPILSVTTNSGSLLRNLLEHSDLWSLSSENLDGKYHGTEGIRLDGKENEVVFGCVRKEEIISDNLQKIFLKGIRKQIQYSKKE